MPLPALLAVLLFGGAALIAAVGSVVVASRFLRSRHGSIDELRQAFEHLADEVTMLEERVDFHERLLTQQRAKAEIGSNPPE